MYTAETIEAASISNATKFLEYRYGCWNTTDCRNCRSVAACCRITSSIPSQAMHGVLLQFPDVAQLKGRVVNLNFSNRKTVTLYSSYDAAVLLPLRLMKALPVNSIQQQQKSKERSDVLLLERKEPAEKPIQKRVSKTNRPIAPRDVNAIQVRKPGGHRR